MLGDGVSRAPRREVVEKPPVRFGVVGMDEGQGASADHRLRVVAEHALGGRRNVALGHVEIGEDDDIAGVLGEQAKPLLVLGQGAFDGPALGDIREGPQSTAVRHRNGPHLEDDPVRSPTLVAQRRAREAAFAVPRHLRRLVGKPVLREPFPDRAEGGTIVKDVARGAEQIARALIVNAHALIGAQNDQPLVHGLDRGAQDLVAFPRLPFEAQRIGHVDDNSVKCADTAVRVDVPEALNHHVADFAIGTDDASAIGVAGALCVVAAGRRHDARPHDVAIVGVEE